MPWWDAAQLLADAVLVGFAVRIWILRAPVAQRVLDATVASPKVRYRVLHFNGSDNKRPTVLYKGTDIRKAKRVRDVAREEHGRRVMLEVEGKLRG